MQNRINIVLLGRYDNEKLTKFIEDTQPKQGGIPLNGIDFYVTTINSVTYQIWDGRPLMRYSSYEARHYFQRVQVVICFDVEDDKKNIIYSDYPSLKLIDYDNSIKPKDFLSLLVKKPDDQFISTMRTKLTLLFFSQKDAECVFSEMGIPLELIKYILNILMQCAFKEVSSVTKFYFFKSPEETRAPTYLLSAVNSAPEHDMQTQDQDESIVKRALNKCSVM